MLEGEADAAENLDAVLGIGQRQLRNERIADERGQPGLRSEVQVISLAGEEVVDRTRLIPGRGTELLAAAEHVGQDVFDRLERSDRRAELGAHLRVVDGGIQAPLCDAGLVGRIGRGQDRRGPRRTRQFDDGTEIDPTQRDA